MALKRIHVSKLRLLTEQDDEKGERIPFSFEYFTKRSGSILIVNNAICTSSCFHTRTMNIKNLDTGKTKTFRNILFKSINGIKIFV